MHKANDEHVHEPRLYEASRTMGVSLTDSAHRRLRLMQRRRGLLGGHTRQRRIALVAVISSITGVGAALSLSLPLLSFVLEERGISSLWIGLNTAVAGAAAICILPFVTTLARLFGTAHLILASFLVMAGTLVLFYLIEAFWLWFPLRFLFSIAITVIFALTEFWINSLAPPSRRGLVIGVYAAFLSIGITAGPVILALTGPDGILPFLIGTIMLIAAAVPVTLVRDSEPILAGESQTRFLAFIVLSPMATLAALVFGAVEAGGTALLPVYGLSIGFGSREAAVLVAAVAVGNIVSQIPIGMLADRVDRRHLMLACAAIGAIGTAVIPLVAQSYLVFLIVLFITGGIVAGLYTVGLTQLGARFTGHDLAAANAAFVMMYSVGMLIGPAAMGLGLELYEPHGFAIAAALFFALYVVAGALRMRARPRPGSR